MGFLDKVSKDLEKAGIRVGSSEPPTYWFSTGNYVLNKIISGSFYRGVPQGRILCFTGPAGAGKSFLAANAMREAQKEGAHIVVLDSENALDDNFVSNIGVDVDPQGKNTYTYISVSTIPETKKVVSRFINGYRAEYEEDDPKAPKMLFVIDSLDMLMTETEVEHFTKGESKGDQGQRSKQLKAMLREFVQNIKNHNISIIVTAQVYKNQDPRNGEGLWIITEAIKFSLSQIVLLTKLKLKGDNEIEGIRMKCEGYKTRFTKPFQTVTIEVPYETGMDPYNGLFDVAVDLGVVEARGAWKYFGEEKWNTKVVPEKFLEPILKACEAKREKYLEAFVEDHEVDFSQGPSSKAKRKAKATGE